MGTLSTLGLNASFSLATNAMGAQRAAIEVTSHNIANSSTPGYARQRVNIVTADPIQTAIGQQGNGVSVAGIEQLRNTYMDQQIPPVLSNLGYYSELKDLLSQVQSNLGEPLDRTSSIAATFPTTPGTGLNSALQGFYDSWRQLSTDPANLTIRREVINNAQNVAGKLNEISERLENTQVQIVNEVSSNITEINDLLANIASLNSNIKSVELGHIGAANDSRDQRQQLLEDLAGRLNIHTTEETDGTMTVRLGDSGGLLLVSGVFSGNTALAGTHKLGTKFTGGTFASIALGSWTGGETETAGNLDSLPTNPTRGNLIAQVEVIRDTIGDTNAGLTRDYDRIAAALAQLVNGVFDDGFTLQTPPTYAVAGNPTFFDNDAVNGNGLGTVTAANIQVNSFVAADPARLAASDTAGQPNNGDNALAIAATQDLLTGTGLGGLTIQNYYLNALTTLGTSINSSDSQITTHKILNDQLEKHRDSTMGVSIDEEMANLLKFQHAFEAASMLINTVNDMMKSVLASAR